MIANEIGVADVADPLGGSHLVEAWTAEIRERARALIRKVDGLGGAVAAIEQGFLQREIEDAAYAAQREIEEGKRAGRRRQRVPRRQGDSRRRSSRSIRDSRPSRSSGSRAFRAAPTRRRRRAPRSRGLEEGAREDRNLMPLLVEAVSRRATLGEIVRSLKGVYGEYRPGN